MRMTAEYDLIKADADRKAEEAGYTLKWGAQTIEARFPKANGKIGVITLPLENGKTLGWLDERLIGLDYFVRKGMALMGRGTVQ